MTAKTKEEHKKQQQQQTEDVKEWIRGWSTVNFSCFSEWAKDRRTEQRTTDEKEEEEGLSGWLKLKLNDLHSCTII